MDRGLDADVVDVVDVVPGETATCGLTVRNTSATVEEYTFHVGDEVRAWTTVEPSHTRLLPGETQRVAFTFRPPRATRPAAGELSYRIYVTVRERPDDQLVLESTLRILPFTDLTAEVSPRTSTSSLWGGQHDVAIDNRGNTPVELRVGGTDPDNALVVEATPDVLTVGPGQAAFTKVRARPSRVRVHGRPVTRQYQISVTPEDTPPLVLDATMVQRPLIAPGSVRVLAGLVALLLLGTGLWYGVVRQAATSAAQDVVREEVAPLADRADSAQVAAQKAAAAAQGAAKQSAPRRPVATPTATTGPGGIPAGATLFSRRLETASGVGQTAGDEYWVPRGRTLMITYVNLQNPWALRGRLDLTVDDRTVFTEEQAYYRNEVRYLPSPIQVPTGSVVRMRTTCAAVGTRAPGSRPGARCLSYVLIGGYLARNAAPAAD